METICQTQKGISSDLVALAKVGDKKAWTEIVDRSERMISSLAWQTIEKTRVDTAWLDDLKQEGRIGLVNAVNNFSSCGAKFETYAWKIVHGKMLDFVRDNLPTPRSLLPKLKQAKKLLGENISNDQIAKQSLVKAGFSAKDITEVLFYQSLMLVSVDEYDSGFLSEESYSEVWDQSEAERMWGKLMLVLESCPCLSDDERLILASCLGRYKTQRQLADDWGVTEAAISTRKRTIISHLKKCFKQKHRDVYEYFAELQ